MVNSGPQIEGKKMKRAGQDEGNAEQAVMLVQRTPTNALIFDRFSAFHILPQRSHTVLYVACLWRRGHQQGTNSIIAQQG